MSLPLKNHIGTIILALIFVLMFTAHFNSYQYQTSKLGKVLVVFSLISIIMVLVEHYILVAKRKRREIDKDIYYRLIRNPGINYENHAFHLVNKITSHPSMLFI